MEPVYNGKVDVLNKATDTDYSNYIALNKIWTAMFYSMAGSSASVYPFCEIGH